MARPTKQPPRLPPIVPDPTEPDFLWRRFVALAYRTTRAILRSRSILGEGQSLARATLLVERGELLSQAFPIPTGDAVVGAAAAFYGANTPTGPQATDPPEVTARIAGMHGTVAIELGIDPEDPVLFWFDPKNIVEAFPPLSDLLEYEHELLTWTGQKLEVSKKSAATAFETAAGGRLHRSERIDFMRLAFSDVAEMAEIPQEEERALMVARLEGVIRRAKQSLDIRTELAACRTIAQIQGLTFQDVDQTQRHMRELFSLPPPADETQPRRIQISHADPSEE